MSVTLFAPMGSTVHFAATFTAVLFLAFPPYGQFVPPGTLAEFLGRLHRVLLMIALCADVVLLHPLLWLLIAVVHFAWIVCAYGIADNHRYLEGYWCLALVGALLVDDKLADWFLIVNARVLIGLAFGCAALAKLLSARYRDGGLLTLKLAVDPRFGDLACLFGGVTSRQRAAYVSVMDSFTSGRLRSAQLDLPSTLKRMAIVLTWWAVAIEVTIAVLFLAPFEHLQMARVAMLIVFVITTYVLIPVDTFGNILMLLLAVATSDPVLRAAVVVGFACMNLAMFIGHRRTAWHRMCAQRIVNNREAHKLTAEAVAAG